MPIGNNNLVKHAVREYEAMKQVSLKQEPTSTVDASTLNEKDAQASSERANQLLKDLHYV